MSKSLRIAYLVFVHKNPWQLARLLQKLYDQQTMFYIYVDGKVNINQFKSAVYSIPSEQVVWLQNRKSISWGDFSLSDAYLSGFQRILQQNPDPDFIITISGQDYPIAPIKIIHERLTQCIDHSIIDHSIITEDAPHILERVQQYYLYVRRHHSIIYPHPNPDKLRKKIFNTLLKMSGRMPLPRQIPLKHQMYFGTNWFQLKPIAARYLVDFAKKNPDYVKFFRSTYVPEEAFFHTILLNATESERGKIMKQRLTYMQWDRPEGAYTSPISVSEIPSMLISGKLFARKFDTDDSEGILDQVDLSIERQYINKLEDIKIKFQNNASKLNVN